MLAGQFDDLKGRPDLLENIEGETLSRRLIYDGFADAISSLCGFA